MPWSSQEIRSSSIPPSTSPRFGRPRDTPEWLALRPAPLRFWKCFWSPYRWWRAGTARWRWRCYPHTAARIPGFDWEIRNRDEWPVHRCWLRLGWFSCHSSNFRWSMPVRFWMLRPPKMEKLTPINQSINQSMDHVIQWMTSRWFRKNIHA